MGISEKPEKARVQKQREETPRPCCCKWQIIYEIRHNHPLKMHPKSPPSRAASSQQHKRQSGNKKVAERRHRFKNRKASVLATIDRCSCDEPPDGTRIGRAAVPRGGGLRSKQEHKNRACLNKKCLCGADMEWKKSSELELVAEQERRRILARKERTTGALLSCHG